MRPLALLVLFVCALLPLCYCGSPWPNEARVLGEALAARMDFATILNETYGRAGTWEGTVPAQPQYGLPHMGDEDGPQGVAGGNRDVTCFPSALTVVSGWDLNAATLFGDAIGKEQRGKGTTVMLGPAINLARIPWCGRLFEYMGEDPVLASAIVTAMIPAVQAHNLTACIKHFTLNVQEQWRHNVSSNCDRRTHMEVYYPAFVAAVNAGVGSVMCSYNRLNGTYACESAQAQIADLRGKFGFQGWVRSDGMALVDTVRPALGGCDQEMPRNVYYGAALGKAVEEGKVTEARVREMMANMFTAMYALNMISDPSPDNNRANVTTDAHVALARSLAANGAVLLKNENNALPLDPSTIKTVAVFGDIYTVTGGGSGSVRVPYVVSPADGLAAAMPGVKVTYYGSDPSTAGPLAAAADVAVVAVGTNSSEGTDRASLSLPAEYDALVAAVAAANARTVVDARCPGPCLMPWLSSVPAVVFTGMSGQEAGNALADVLVAGRVNPSGKLILSFPTSMNDTWLSTTPGGPIDPEMYPGTDRGNGYPETDFKEGLFFGYRWFDQQNIEPLFPFGYGLSYTTFAYSGFTATVGAGPSVSVSLTVQNSGKVPGAEIVQVYVAFPASAGEPPQLLKAFHKTAVLAPAASENINWTLNADSFSVFDVVSDDWVVVHGNFGIYAGSSSRDIRAKAQVTL